MSLRDAMTEGRAAEPGTPNPYAGDDELARAWMVGYQTMLANMLADSPARQAFTGD